VHIKSLHIVIITPDLSAAFVLTI